MKQTRTGLVIAFGGVCLLAVVYGLFYINEYRFSNQLSKLAIPSGCSFLKKQYLPNSLDAPSRLEVQYLCSATGGQIRQSIIDSATKSGYKAFYDDNHPSPPELSLGSYSLAYSGHGDYLDYQLHTKESISSRATPPIDSTMITNIVLTISSSP